MINAFTNAAAAMIQQILRVTRDFLNKFIFGDEGPAPSFRGVSPPSAHCLKMNPDMVANIIGRSTWSGWRAC